MPSFASSFKEEIIRLARREIKGHVQALRKAATQHRSQIAALKRESARLNATIVRLAKGAVKAQAVSAEEEEPLKARFSSKSVISQRKRLGLSAEAFGKLVGVSAMTIYSWERGKSKARKGQLTGLAAVRGIGKREARERLGGGEQKVAKKVAKRAAVDRKKQ